MDIGKCIKTKKVGILLLSSISYLALYTCTDHTDALYVHKNSNRKNSIIGLLRGGKTFMEQKPVGLELLDITFSQSNHNHLC